MNLRHWVLAIGLGLLPLALGCLKRTEKINITSSGAVTIAIEYEGEKGDFETLDALPSEQSGWKVSRETQVKEDKKEEIRLTGERTFAPGEELPASYAAPTDAQTGPYLKFPTTLTRERRKDGVYLHFRRVYVPRDWAYVQFWADQHIDDNIKKLGEKKPEELTHEERVQFIQAFAGVEAYKQIELAQRALKESDAGLKPDEWLLARQALLKVYEEVDWQAIATRHENTPQEQRDQQLERESQRILDEGHRAFVRSLKQDARYDDQRTSKFEAALGRAKKSYDITNQLGGHAFEIEVTMPGTVVAHNAEKDVEDGTVQWQFDGTAFRDRPFELMVTSRLPLEHGDKD